MAILITGLGYIGARLAEDLLADGERVVAVENFFCTPRRDVRHLAGHPALTLVEGSINHPATLRRALAGRDVRALVHLAAQPSAHPQAATPAYTERTNLTGARLTLEAAAEAGVALVVLGSSFKVYGDDLPPLVREDQPYGRVGDLAHLSKIYLEKLAELMAADGAFRCVSVRLGITHGLGSVMKTDPRFMIVANRFAQLTADGQPLTIHPTAIRPAGFIHLADASLALRAALAADFPESYRAVNAVGECASVGEVARQVEAAARARGLAVSVSGPRGDPPVAIQVETSLPERLFRPARRLAESIPEVLDYFLARRGRV
jgi:nucleoside-diphosphate-sugar epimerase